MPKSHYTLFYTRASFTRRLGLISRKIKKILRMSRGWKILRRLRLNRMFTTQQEGQAQFYGKLTFKKVLSLKFEKF